MDALGVTGPPDWISQTPPRRADVLEGAAAGLRVRMLRALGCDWPAGEARPLRTPPRRRRAEAAETALLAAAREHALRRVHDSARDAHAQWRDGADAAEAMRRLGIALGTAAEFEV